MTDAAALASLASQANAWIDEFVTDDKEELMPAFSVHGDVAYSVVPAVRRVKKIVGKGKEKQEVEEMEAQMAVITSEQKLLPYDDDVLQPRALYPHPEPYIPMPPFKWHQDDVIKYAKGKTEARTTPDIYEELMEVWKDHAEFGDPIYYKLMALYVMQTYMYTIWSATGYVHFNGTAGSGKSRCLQIIEAVGYNGRSAMNISPSAMFRTINGNPGVLCIDEAEAFKSEKDAEVYKLLLGGYDQHGRAIVNDKIGDKYRPTAYITYCPKAIASITLLDSTLASRTLVVPMVPAIRNPEELPDDGDWRYLRNDLHVWALSHAVEIQRLSKAWNSHARHQHARELVNRAWQIARPYLVLAASFDEELVKELIDFFNVYYVEMRAKMQQADSASLVLQCLPKVIKTKPAVDIDEDGAWYTLQQIHDVVLDHLEEDQHDYYRTKHTFNSLAALRVGPLGENDGRKAFKFSEQQVRDALRRRMVAPFSEDARWYNGEESYRDQVDPKQAAMDEFQGW